MILNKIIFTECAAGRMQHSTDGCQDCPADHWSEAGNKADTCTACPEGKEVGAGLGKQESDCTWSKYSVLAHILRVPLPLLRVVKWRHVSCQAKLILDVNSGRT